MNTRALVVALITLALGLTLFRFGTGHLRGFGGDVGIVVLGVSGLAALRLGSTRARLLGMGGFAVGAELFQGLGLVGRDAHWLLHLTLGSTFDPLDLLAYAIGVGVALALEGWYGSPPETADTAVGCSIQRR